MNRDELLDKLAMEWCAWPDFNNGEAPTPNAPGVWYTNLGQWMCSAHNDPLDVSERHWLARRTELINEPDDSEAPEWARWKAQDADGKWHWYVSEPSNDSANIWLADADDVFFASHGKILAGHDWKNTLKEINPVQPEYNPRDVAFTLAKQDAARLDAQLRDAINPNHYRQGGIECIDALKAATTGKRGIEAVCAANVIKYLWRYEEKNGAEDVRKAQWYLNRLLEELNP